MLVTAIPIPSAHNQEAVCAGVADKFWAAWKISATELVNPTSTATKPAVTADSEKSLNIGPELFDTAQYHTRRDWAGLSKASNPRILGEAGANEQGFKLGIAAHETAIEFVRR